MFGEDQRADLYEVLTEIISIDARAGVVRPADVEKVIARSKVDALLANEVYAGIFRQSHEPQRNLRRGDPAVCDYFAELEMMPNLTTELTDVCFTLMEQQQTGAREFLVKAYLAEAAKVACMVCRKYACQNTMDMIGVANERLIKCVDSYRRPSPAQFRTYLSRSVAFSVHDAIFEGRTPFSMPSRVRIDCGRIAAFQGAFVKETGEAPTTKDIARGLDLPETQVQDCLRAMSPMVSLTDVANAQSEDLIPANGDEPVEDAVLWSIILDQCSKDYPKATQALTIRQQEALKSYLGGESGQANPLLLTGAAPSARVICRRAHAAIANLRDNKEFYTKYLGSV